MRTDFQPRRSITHFTAFPRRKRSTTGKRRHRHDRYAKEDYRRLRLPPAPPRRLSNDRHRTLGRLRAPTGIELERHVRLFQARRKRHRAETRAADVEIARVIR